MYNSFFNGTTTVILNRFGSTFKSKLYRNSIPVPYPYTFTAFNPWLQIIPAFPASDVSLIAYTELHSLRTFHAKEA